jgi:DNA repair exonuclease SbcCD ATPase subunit
MDSYITALSVENVRGISGTYELGPCSMIIGDNFRGKTALLCAIRLAVFGFLPHPRKDKMVPPMELASGDHMSVAIQLSDGSEYSREWTRDRKGKVTSSCTPDVIDLAPAILVDPKEYFDLSADKRMKYVFSSVRLEGQKYTPEAIVAELKNLRLEENTEHTETALTAIISAIDALVAEFVAESGTATVQDLVSTMIESLTNGLKLAKQGVDRMAKTTAGLAELQLKKPEDFENDIAAVNAEIGTARKVLEKIVAERGALVERSQQVIKTSGRRNELTSAIASEAALQKELTNSEQALAQLKEQEAVPLSLIDITALDQRCDSVTQALDAARKDARDKVLQEHALRTELMALNTDITKAETERNTIMGQRLPPDLCLDCTEKLTSKMTEQAKPLELRLAELKTQHGPLTAKCDAVSAEIDKLNANIATLDKSWKDAHGERTRASQSNSIKQNDRNTLTNSVRAHETTVSRARQRVATIDDNKRELASLPPDDSELAKLLDDVNSRHAAQSQVIRDLETKQRQAIGAKTDSVRQLEAHSERIKAEATRDMHKAAVERLTEIQREMVDASFSSLMGVTHEFCDGILGSQLEYDKESGEVGRRRDGRWVSIEQFSDSEQIIAYAAMTTALAAAAQFKLVLIDEITRVRGERKSRILERMTGLISAKIVSQFIGVDVCDDLGQVPSYYTSNPAITIVHLPGLAEPRAH